eukprot:CAMPEP_0181422580 /NCGR_PEP_ID=MMETSP1110-20121109/13685_1 /TAXON_ID=174948 /ORGANISM="Symbiodinium sp., Strain CCMP421" /LENGTH=72 /DNA_ID=CAMNT_0023545677 /DNA_START=48 /DNA_END=266 /DNA_ORIENTATION=-
MAVPATAMAVLASSPDTGAEAGVAADTVARRFPVRAVGADTKAAPPKSATPAAAEATVARDAEAISYKKLVK